MQFRQFRVLTWNVHPRYLAALAQAPHLFYLPVTAEQREPRPVRRSLPANVFEVPAGNVRDLPLDAVLCQSRANYELHRFELLSSRQLHLPHLYLELDPPAERPAESKHIVDDPAVMLVHGTHFNQVMWDSGRSPSVVIEPAVAAREQWSGELNSGVAVVHQIFTHGRSRGLDLYLSLRGDVPLDLFGEESEAAGGRGDIPLPRLHAFMRRYRFFFSPARYTGFDFALCDAMMMGMPVVAFATTETASLIHDGVSGLADTNPAVLVEHMQELLKDPQLARRLGEAGRRTAQERFSMARFIRDWDALLRAAILGTSFDIPHAPLGTLHRECGAPLR